MTPGSFATSTVTVHMKAVPNITEICVVLEGVCPAVLACQRGSFHRWYGFCCSGGTSEAVLRCPDTLTSSTSDCRIPQAHSLHETGGTAWMALRNALMLMVPGNPHR